MNTFLTEMRKKGVLYLKRATAVLTIGSIIFVYPFVRRYFIKEVVR